MKKFLLLAIVAFCSISHAAAQQWQDYYVVEEVGQENASVYWFRVDWGNKYFFMDSDSEDEQKAPIKNYRENGNKRTFDVHYPAMAGGSKFCSIEFITEEDGKYKLTQIIDNYKATYILSDKKPLKGGSDDTRKNPKELIKGGVDKVTNLFKKKDKK